MKVLKFGLAIFIILRFNAAFCMKEDFAIKNPKTLDQAVVEMDTAGAAASTSQDLEPKKLSGVDKTASGATLVDLGRERVNTFTLGEFYHSDTKTLDLSHKPMKDPGLKMIFDHIKHFVAENDVEILLLESMELTEVPYYLITYALVDKHLKVVSFLNNKFTLPGLPIAEPGSLPTSSSTDQFSSIRVANKKRASVSIPQPFQSGQAASGLHGGAGVVAGVISTLWESFSPEIARELEEQNLTNGAVPMFKKIIFIDKRIPPFTVFDQTQAAAMAAPSKCQRFKYIVERALYTIAGTLVSFLPNIIIFFTTKKDDLSKCDEDALQQMMTACNVNASQFRSVPEITAQAMFEKIAVDSNLN